jgi:hypothetical protein
MRSLFVAYIDEANNLVQKPRFYNTVAANCATPAYHMMKHIVGYLSWNYSLLLTGYLPEYVYRIGGLTLGYSFEELRALSGMRPVALLAGVRGDRAGRRVARGCPGPARRKQRQHLLRIPRP